MSSGAEHFGEEFAAGLPVAVFAGERSAITDDEVGGLFDELAELGDSVFRLQIEIEAGVHAGVAEVSVERAFVIEGGHQLAKVAEIGAEFFGSDGGVFPAFPVQRLAGDVRGYAETGLRELPRCAWLARRNTGVRWAEWRCG